MEDDRLRFPAMGLTKNELEEKFNLKLSDNEWKLLKSHAIRSWAENSDELRSLVIKHIRNGLGEIGYKPIIDGTVLKFRQVND